MAGYVELHAHSAYSFLDGASQPEELAALVSYVRSIQGSNPPNARAPEGEPAVPEPIPGR